MSKRKVLKPKPFRLSKCNRLEVCEEITAAEFPMRPHIFGTLDYLTYRDWPKLAAWLNEASQWLSKQDK